MKPKVAVLFARSDSCYKTLECDVWDASRDALLWPGGSPVVAHPPCRLWGAMFAFSTAPETEKELARFSVRMIRRYGGVLEHPARSKLWKDANLPLPGKRDEWGGFTLSFPQFWFGHKAEKWTWVYVAGIDPKDIPSMPLIIGESSHVIGVSRKKRDRPEVTKAEREHTPIMLARYLLDVAAKCVPPIQPIP